MKTLAVSLMVCVTVAFISVFRCATDYNLQKQRLEIEQAVIQLDVLKYINAQNDKAERELRNPPITERPSLELNNL